jgi:hypothetical protein
MDCIVANVSEVIGDLIRQHFFQAQAEQVRGVPTVGSGNHVTT